MWLIQILLAWYLLFIMFRWFLFGGKDKESPVTQSKEPDFDSHDRSNYFMDAPDALRPEIEPDHFDPSDFM